MRSGPRRDRRGALCRPKASSTTPPRAPTRASPATDPSFLSLPPATATRRCRCSRHQLALVEGARGLPSDGFVGMAAVHLALSRAAASFGVPCGGQQGAVRLLPLDLPQQLGPALRHRGPTFVDAAGTTGAWKAAMRPNTKVVFIETPASRPLEIADIAVVAAMAREVRAKVLVGNRLRHPMIFQKPLQLGADIVIYSATKHIDGQGRLPGRRGARARPRCSRRATATSFAIPARRSRRSTPGCC